MIITLKLWSRRSSIPTTVGCNVVGHADDIAIVTHLLFNETLRERMQRTLDPGINGWKMKVLKYIVKDLSWFRLQNDET